MSTAVTLARPYAKAAFALARQRDCLDPWSRALAFAAAVASDSRVKLLIGDPNLDNRTLDEVFAPEDAPEGFDNLLRLLISNDRLPALPQISALFDELKAEAERTMQVTVCSAIELDSAYRERLIGSLARRFDRRIELKCVIDPSVIGGAVIQAGDTVIDGSLRRKLALMAEAITPRL